MSLRRWAWCGLAAAMLAAAGLRAGLIVHRYYDTDELEHLHAALLVARGNLPFRDFFEHHGPLFWAALAPVVEPPHDPVSKALAGRLFMTLFWLGTLGLVARPRRGASPLEGALAAAWLAAFAAFAQKSLEIRPDVPGMFLVVAAAYAITRPGRGAGPLAGVLLGLALWCTPKAAFPAAGMLLAAAWRRADKEGAPAARRLLGHAALGAGAVAAVGCAYFAARGGLGRLWSYYFLYNLGFPGARVSWSATLRPSLLSDPLMWAAGLWGLRRWRAHPEEAGALAAALAGLAVTPSAYSQHLLFVAPFLAGFASREAIHWSASRRRALLASAALAASFLIPAVGAMGLIRYGNELQRERWRCVTQLLPNGAAVWDTWTGDSFHRPHAAFTWFIPDDSQAYYEPAFLERQYSEALAAPRTRGAVRCVSCLERLPKGITAAFDKYFEPSGCGRLWLRKRGV
ncbi:MAG: hypothetical protein PHS14_12685 [Elusimicrobia bacterium]|nr:hypothetical protein [Elusimicrobiota bacterium]